MIIQLEDDKYAVIVSYRLLKIIVALFGTRTGTSRKSTREESSEIYYDGFEYIKMVEGVQPALSLGHHLVDRSEPPFGFMWETKNEM
jgi:hypothetical protein